MPLRPGPPAEPPQWERGLRVSWELGEEAPSPESAEPGAEAIRQVRGVPEARPSEPAPGANPHRAVAERGRPRAVEARESEKLPGSSEEPRGEQAVVVVEAAQAPSQAAVEAEPPAAARVQAVWSPAASERVPPSWRKPILRKIGLRKIKLRNESSAEAEPWIIPL